MKATSEPKSSEENPARTKLEDRVKMDTVQLFFSIRGRINRKTYWCALLPLVVACAVAEVMKESTDQAMVGLGYIILIVLLWPSLAVQIKRWHDRNKSGWWQLINFIPLVGPIWAFIELGFLPGTYGVNRYNSPAGPRPSYDYGARTGRAKNPYLADPRRSETVADGGSVKNAWRGI